MTFTELVALFDREKRLFIGTLGVAIILLLLAYQFQPVGYTSELLLSVTRTSVATTTEYAYDHFYRLQADERMAESISEYLQSETGKRDVAEIDERGKPGEEARIAPHARGARSVLRAALGGSGCFRRCPGHLSTGGSSNV